MTNRRARNSSQGPVSSPAADWLRDGWFINHLLDLCGHHAEVSRHDRFYASVQVGAKATNPPGTSASVPPGNRAMNYYADRTVGGTIPWEIDETGFGAWSLVDPTARRKVDEPAPTVFSCCLDFLDRKWEADWEPKTRQSAVRDLRRTCLFLLRRGSPEPGAEVEGYLDAILTGPAKRPAHLDGVAQNGHLFLTRWSAPIAEVTRDDLEKMVAHYRVNRRSPDRSISPATERRFVADVKQLWSDASARHGFANPWSTIRARTRSNHGRKASGRKASRRIEAIDRNVVLSPSQVVEMADACVRHGNGGEIARCFVLVMGFCGLRPGEAAELNIADLLLDHDGGNSWIEVKRSRRKSQEKWLEPGEDPGWGPLKDRTVGDSRRVPDSGLPRGASLTASGRHLRRRDRTCPTRLPPPRATT